MLPAITQDHRAADVMKQPTTDSGKFSLPGVLAVKRVNGIPTVFPAGEVSQEENMLKVGVSWAHYLPCMCCLYSTGSTPYSTARRAEFTAAYVVRCGCCVSCVLSDA